MRKTSSSFGEFWTVFFWFTFNKHWPHQWVGWKSQTSLGQCGYQYRGVAYNLYHPVPTRSDVKKKRGANRGNRVILERKKLLLTKSCFLHDLCFSFFSTGRIWIKKVQFGLPKVEEDTRLDGLSHLHGLGVVNLIRSTHRDPESQHLRRVGHDFENTMSEEDKEPGWFDDMDEFDWDDASWRHKKIISKSQTKLNSGNKWLFFRGTCFFIFFWGVDWLFFSQLQNCYPSGWTSQGELGGTHRLNWDPIGWTNPTHMGKRFGGATPSNSGDFLWVFFWDDQIFDTTKKLGGVVVSGHNSSILLPET